MSIIYSLAGLLLKDSSTLKKIHNAKNILLVSMQGMGDNLMITPLIHSLSQHGCTVDILVGNTLSKRILENNKDISTIIEFHNKIKTIQYINKQKYDLIYLAHGAGPKSGLLFTLLQAKYKVSHVYNLGGKNTGFKANIVIAQTPKMHRVEENLKLLNVMGLAFPTKPKYYLKTTEKDKRRVTEFWEKNKLTGKQIIGIHPGGDKQNPQKRYPIQKYMEFVQSLKQNQKAVFFLGPDEITLAEQLRNQLIFTGNIKEIAIALQKCDTLIHTDSGLGHLAAAMGTKTLTIVGVTNWHRTRPYGNNDRLCKDKKTPEPVERKMEQGYILKKAHFPSKIRLLEK